MVCTVHTRRFLIGGDICDFPFSATAQAATGQIFHDFPVFQFAIANTAFRHLTAPHHVPEANSRVTTKETNVSIHGVGSKHVRTAGGSGIHTRAHTLRSASDYQAQKNMRTQRVFLLGLREEYLILCFIFVETSLGLLRKPKETKTV